jgi:ABC-type Na+ efflux pump permease subunit
MDKNKMIILALIVVIAALLVGMAFTMMPNMGKQDTKLKFKSNSTLKEGDSLKIKLTDANGTAIANQTVNITIKDKKGASDSHSVVTNAKGVGTLKLDKGAGKYNVTVSYGGNDKYNGCNATKKITIKEKVAEAETTSSSSSSSSYSNYDGSEQVDYNSRDSDYFKSETGEGYLKKQPGVDYVYAQDGRTGEWSYWLDKSK